MGILQLLVPPFTAEMSAVQISDFKSICFCCCCVTNTRRIQRSVTQSVSNTVHQAFWFAANLRQYSRQISVIHQLSIFQLDI